MHAFIQKKLSQRTGTRFKAEKEGWQLNSKIMSSAYEPLFHLTRGGIIESQHRGALAVADIHGELLAWVGDPQHVIFLRSSSKPFQALPLIESGAAEHFGLSLKQIALVCASHAGSQAHVEAAEAIQKAVGVEEADLLCGVHVPGDKEAARLLAIEGKDPRPNQHNCSGKHSGMLALARYLAESIDNYLEFDHPVQRRILATLAEMCDLEESQIVLGVDGCSAPNFALPLAAAAKGVARLADPTGLPEERAQACRTVFEAMTTHPEMVSGKGRFDTRLMEVAGGKILSKGGAEGYQAAAIAPGAAGDNSPAMGLVVKAADGNSRAVQPATLAVLKELGVLGDAELAELEQFSARKLRNYRGIEVGEACISFRLRRSGQ
jgi:L-asparaginase II